MTIIAITEISKNALAGKEKYNFRNDLIHVALSMEAASLFPSQELEVTNKCELFNTKIWWKSPNICLYKGRP